MTTLLLAFALSFTAHAEYRAFELIIKNVETGNERTVRSTLDHLQYPAYYPVTRGEVVSYSTSWRCRGNTGDFKRLCPNPKDTNAQLKPNSEAPRSPAASP